MKVKDVFEESYWYRCLYTFLNWLSDYGICIEMETNTYFSNLELSVTFAISSALLLAQVAIIIADMAIKCIFSLCYLCYFVVWLNPVFSEDHASHLQSSIFISVNLAVNE